MEVWPSDVGLRGQASNHPVLRWLKTVVVSDRDKARLNSAYTYPCQRFADALTDRNA